MRFKKSEIKDIERYRVPKNQSALLPPLGGQQHKKAGHQEDRYTLQ
nr:MAG TPA: hypothetical protein [Caudoviricetes sp.]